MIYYFYNKTLFCYENNEEKELTVFVVLNSLPLYFFYHSKWLCLVLCDKKITIDETFINRGGTEYKQT